MNILCASFLDKSAYWVRKISLGKIIGGHVPPVPHRFLRPCYLHARIQWNISKRRINYKRQFMQKIHNHISKNSLTSSKPFWLIFHTYDYNDTDQPVYDVGVNTTSLFYRADNEKLFRCKNNVPAVITMPWLTGWAFGRLWKLHSVIRKYHVLGRYLVSRYWCVDIKWYTCSYSNIEAAVV